ncbi:MAG: DNA polymerase III subunit alpha [Candidatus Zambryskibacteria bacterium]|nr:DNA polymerase III subunit alpha [Candidatus Zambryskibacteria bacterium]
MFTHLRTHSHYSLLEALPKIPELIKKAKDSGMTSLALTDSGNLYGAIEFYKECLEHGIKPIIGVDFYVALRTRHDKEARIDNSRSRLVLLAENLTGYHNLLKLVTASYLEGFYYKPRIDRELLEKYNEGLIAIAKEEKNYKEIFKDRFYLESSLAIYDVYYLDPADRPALNTVLSIQEHLNRGGAFDEEQDLSFRTPEQARKDFSREALENTAKIADRCNLKLDLGKWIFPELEIPDGQSPDEALRNIVFDGIEKRGLEKTPEVLERIEYELKVIKDKGFQKYLLVVSDLLRYAHEHDILTNVRGSVAGSMITYLAGITNINPLEYQLPFERFLNPDRPSPPDIDLDIADNRRDELIEYTRKKYGENHVAQIGTFGTMMARGAVRDVTRAMGFSYELGDQIAKLIPFGAQGFPMTIERAFKESPELKEMYDSDADTRTILDMAQKIEGNARHVSVHAAGVVISPTALTDYTALQYDTKGEQKVITQYDMYSLDPNAGGEMTVGLLKFDLLGIRNLATIAETFERLKKIEGKELRLEDIPLDDKKTFEMLARGETEGTFQLNGPGMTKALMELKPTAIYDINVMVALYRPGPMDNINEYIARKHGEKPITYLHPKMKNFLEPTYGVLVYQDDLLLTAIEVAGYSWGEVDKFRKAVGKKIPEEMKKQHMMFVQGCITHGKMTRDKAEALWDLFVPFQGYGFNKAHAASYGHIAYITAYLKANFPEIYMSAVLTAESGDVNTIGIMVNECKRMGIEVLPPSINESFSQFSVIPLGSSTSKLHSEVELPRKYKIRFGLTTIKNFGQGISSSITAERKRVGKFKSLADFLDRIKDKNLNKKSLESLIKSGALEEFGERGELLANLDNLLSYHREQLNASDNQSSLFDLSSLPALRLEKAPEATLRDKLSWEKELLGLYVSGHPLEQYKEKFMSKEMNIKKLSNFREGTEAVIAGCVEGARDVLTKNNERMVFMKLADFSGSIEVAVFPRVLADYRQYVRTDNCIAIKGRVSKRKGETSFIAEKIKAL